MKQAAAEGATAAEGDRHDPLLEWTGFPWWSPLGLAAAVYGLLQWIATRAVPAGVADSALDEFAQLQRLALLGRHWIPLSLIVLAVWAGLTRWRRARKRSLHRLVLRHQGAQQGGQHKLQKGVQTGQQLGVDAGPQAPWQASDPLSLWPPQQGTARAILPNVPVSQLSDEGWARPARPAAWDLALLQSVEWKRFEALCAGYFERCGFESAMQGAGTNGQRSIVLRGRNSPSDIYGIVHCADGESGEAIGVKPIRDLLIAMADRHVRRGIFVTAAAFTRDAREFADGNPVFLLDGESLLQSILSRPEGEQRELLSIAIQGDYTVPSCPGCGSKTQRKRGFSGKPYWACVNRQTRCRYKRWVGREAPRLNA